MINNIENEEKKNETGPKIRHKKIYAILTQSSQVISPFNELIILTKFPLCNTIDHLAEFDSKMARNPSRVENF